MTGPINPISGKPLGGVTPPATGGATGSGISGAIGGAEKTIQNLFGANSIGQQFLIYGVLQQLLSGALGPAVADIAQAVNSGDPVITLTPEQLAVGVIREILDPGNSQSEAAKSGIGAGRFQQLIELAQQPPSLGILLAAHQRTLGQVGPGADAGVDLDKALADLGIGEQYRSLVKAQAILIPTAGEVLNAWLEGQIEEGEAVARIRATGLDPSWIQTAYNANGQAPTPVEALELWNRGIIPEGGTGPGATSYEQAFREGPWRNKWLEAFKALRFYIPPPRTVQAMLREGSISEAKATEWLNASGVYGDTLAAFLVSSSHSATPAARELSRTDVVDLYESQLITAEQAVSDLAALKYTADDARLIIALADKKLATAASKTAITRLKNLFLAGTNTSAQSRAALNALGIPDQQIANLLAVWGLEQATAVRTLTESQIVAAWYYNRFADDAPTNNQIALTRLQQLGYSAGDATILLEIRAKGPLPNA